MPVFGRKKEVEIPLAWGHDAPEGVVVMWHGRKALMPSGWRECNGQHGTADLTMLAAQQGVTFIERVK